MTNRWPEISLGDVCEVQRGGSPRPIDQFITDDCNGINWIKIGDVAEGAKYLWTTKQKIRPEGAKRSRAVESGDFLLTNSMSFGRPYILRTSGCIHDGWLVLHFDKTRLTEDYLYHALGSDYVYAQFVKGASGAVVKNLNSEVVKKVRILLPTLPEQHRIAAILDKADALRIKRREALAQFDRLSQSVFVEMFGDPELNPRSWPVATLGDVAIKITDGEHLTPERQEAGIKLLSARNVRDGYLDFSDVDYVNEAEYLRISKRCKPEMGDVLISCSGSIGRVAPVETTEPLALVRSAALVKPNLELVTTRFLEAWLRTPFMYRLMVKSAKSSSQANLFQGPIRSLPIIVPPKGQQQDFDNRLATISRIRNIHLRAAEEIEALFLTLQHHAFRGAL